MPSSIRQHLLGVLELSLFMRRGIERFGNDRRGMWLSYLWPVCLFPVSIISVFVAQRPEIAGVSSLYIILFYAIRDAIVLVLFYAFASRAAEYLGKADDLPRFIMANNWLSINDAVLSIPILVMLATGQEWISTYGVITVISLYGYGLFGYVTMRTFKLPWELGVMAAAIALGLNEMTLKILFDVFAWLSK